MMDSRKLFFIMLAAVLTLGAGRVNAIAPITPMSVVAAADSVSGVSQTTANPLVGAWQWAVIDDAGGITYRDVVKVYTPSGLLKGVGKLQTQKDGYMWLDGSYEQKGDGSNGTYTEHCKWHHMASYTGKDVVFTYTIKDDTLILSYQSNPQHTETWVRVAKLTPSANYTTRSEETSRSQKKYERDKAANSNKPFGLPGLWRKGSLNLNMGFRGYVDSMKDLKKQYAFVDLDASGDGYALFCEDGFVFAMSSHPHPVVTPKVTEILKSLDDYDENKDEDMTKVRRNSGKDNGKLIYYDCGQYSVLSSVELGLDPFCGRMIFYSLCEEIYQVVNNNAAGQLFADYFIWKVGTKQQYRVPTLQIEVVPE